jgi:hypothetical protein
MTYYIHPLISMYMFHFPFRVFTVTCEDKTYVSIYNGFASPDLPPDDTLCGQLYFIKTNIAEFKANPFRVVSGEQHEHNKTIVRLILFHITSFIIP